MTTVLASEGYPNSARKDVPITIPEQLPDGVTVYHAGTARRDDGALITDSGRVLAVTALAATFPEAQAMSRDAAARIQFQGKQFRRDIGWRESNR